MSEYEATGRNLVATLAERNWRSHLSPFFDRVKISELSTADFTDYRIHRLREGAAQATVNRERQHVIAAYKIGYRSQPPKVERMPYIRLTKEDNARKTFISDAQRDSLLAEASKVGLWARVLLEMAVSWDGAAENSCA